MKSVTAYPFRRTGADCVMPSAWLNPAGNEAFPDRVFRTWDPGTDLELKRTFVIDPAKIAADCGLGRAAKLRLACGWESDGTAVRESAVRVDFSIGTATMNRAIEMKVPAALLRSAVKLLSTVVLLDSDSKDPLAPSQPGSRLWRDETEILLEGCGARFPVELVQFPADSRYAGWQMDISDDLDWPFLGAVRLFINADHEAVRTAVSSADPGPADQLIRTVIYHDVGRQLVSKALSLDDFRSRYDANRQSAPYPENSVGRALWSLIRNFFPDRSAQELNRMRVDQPADFEAVLQHTFRILGSRNG